MTVNSSCSRPICRALSFFLCLVLLAAILPLSAFAEEGTRQGYITANDVQTREGPSTSHALLRHNGALIKLNSGHSLKVYGESVPDAKGGSIPWYKVSYIYEGQEFHGYIRSDLMRVIENTTPEDPTPEQIKSFEEQLALFPESYHAPLRAIHALHPTWNFEAFDTGLDWATVQQNENVFGRSMTDSAYKSHYSTAPGSYDWESDTYFVLEGSNWYQAHPDLVAYYMDPRNFLNETDLFQFEKQTYNAATQTEEIIETVLQGSFMAGKSTTGPDGEEISYAKAFLLASQQAKVSAFLLVTRCIQEVGWSGSDCTNGRFENYEGYYNFFSIGAYNGAEDGMRYAKEQGWDTPYKSILAGAFFLVDGYLSAGQDTPYFVKFSVVDPDKYYWHQYMTAVHAAYSDGVMQRNKYATLGLLETPHTFRIPIYHNMPSHPCAKPAALNGSPNNYLKTLTIDGYSLTPTFDFYDTLYYGTSTYTLIINGNVPSIRVNATASGKNAKITGHVGNVPIATGENYLTITCTAENTTIRNYYIRVILNGEGSSQGPGSEAPPETPIPSGWDPAVTLRGTTMTGIRKGTDVTALIASLGLYGRATATVSDANGETVTGGSVRTGYRVNYFDGSSTTVYYIVIYGDTNGDSDIDAIDLLLIRRKLIGLSQLDSSYLVAADVNRDGLVDAIDLLLVRKSLLGLADITQ